MNRLTFSLLLLAMIFLLPVVGSATTYQWRDDDGVSHFTDNQDRIPLRYLPRVRELPSVRGTTPTAAPVTAATPAPIAPAPQPAGDGRDWQRWQTQFRKLRQEMETSKSLLVIQKEELGKLHHQWTVRKGRNPSPEELKAYEKKRAKGDVALKDNPYVNRNALSASGRNREAYFDKLEEVRKNEERLRQLQADLETVERDADRAGVPREWRQ